MKKLILVTLMTVSSLQVFAQTAKPVAAKATVAAGKVERMDAGENQATVKIQGVQKLYVIPQMTAFSADKLEKLSAGKEVELKVDATSNQILEIK